MEKLVFVIELDSKKDVTVAYAEALLNRILEQQLPSFNPKVRDGVKHTTD